MWKESNISREIEKCKKRKIEKTIYVTGKKFLRARGDFIF